MSNVKLILSFNQFDAVGSLFLQNIDSQERQLIHYVLPNTCGPYVRQAALQFEQNDLILIGDNREFLNGLQNIILEEYIKNYDNNTLNITIIT